MAENLTFEISSFDSTTLFILTLSLLVISSAHKGKDRRELMEKYFEVVFIPAYSCELN